MRIRAYTEPMSPLERHERDRELTCERLETLGRNLAVAGALALAWRLGNQNGAEWWAGRAVRKLGP